MNRATFPRPLQGIIVPMVTPLLRTGRLDHGGLERLVEHLIAGGIHGIFVLGSTGEGPALSYAMRRELIRLTCGLVKGRVPVLVGITDTSFEESRSLAGHAALAGADGVVCAAPYYFAVSQNDLYGWVERLSIEVPMPLFLYNMPSLTKAAFAPETVRRATTLPNVWGIKDSSGAFDYVREMTEVLRFRSEFTVLVGPENLLLRSLRAGAHGGVNGGANLFPHLFVALHQAVKEGDLEGAERLQGKIDGLGRLLYALGEPESSYIRGLKLGLALTGICDCGLTAPFRAANPAEHEELREQLKEFEAL